MVTRRICPWPNPASGARSPVSHAPIGPGVLRHLVVRSATPPREPVLENILRHRRARRGPARMRAPGEPSLAFDPRRISSGRSPSSTICGKLSVSAFSSTRSSSAPPPTSSPRGDERNRVDDGGRRQRQIHPACALPQEFKVRLHSDQPAEHRHQSKEDGSARGRDAARDHHRPAAFEQHDVPAEDHGEKAARHHRKAEDEKRDDHADPVTHTRRRGFYGCLFS